MTLIDFIAIFTVRRKLLFAIVVGILLLSLALYRLQIKSYEASLLLSVTRLAVQESSDYHYDQLYRLQADERFADTLVRFLESGEAGRSLKEAGDLTGGEAILFSRKGVRATRLSSQLIEVRYRVRSERAGKRLGDAIVTLSNQYTEELNETAHDPAWFLVIGTPALLSDARFTWKEMFLGGVFFGLLVAFWTALLDHALSNQKKSPAILRNPMAKI